MRLRRGWYFYPNLNLHVLATHFYGNDLALEWVAVRGESLAFKIYHGARTGPDDVVFAHNTKRLLLRHLNKHPERYRKQDIEV
jgi:hypothetical protein